MSSKSLNLVSKPYFHVLDDNEYASEYSNAISHIDATSSLMCDPDVSVHSVLANAAQCKSVFAVDDEGVYGFAVHECPHDFSVMLDDARSVVRALKSGDRSLPFILSVMLNPRTLTTFSCAPTPFEYEDYEDGRGCGERIAFSPSEYIREITNSVHFPEYTGMPFGKMYAGVGQFHTGQLMSAIPTGYALVPTYAPRYIIGENEGRSHLFVLTPLRFKYVTGSNLPKPSMRRLIPFADTIPFQGPVSMKAREVIRKVENLFKPRGRYSSSTSEQFFRLVEDDFHDGVVARPDGYLPHPDEEA
jgi:hypothetical protein